MKEVLFGWAAKEISEYGFLDYLAIFFCVSLCGILFCVAFGMAWNAIANFKDWRDKKCREKQDLRKQQNKKR